MLPIAFVAILSIKTRLVPVLIFPLMKFILLTLMFLARTTWAEGLSIVNVPKTTSLFPLIFWIEVPFSFVFACEVLKLFTLSTLISPPISKLIALVLKFILPPSRVKLPFTFKEAFAALYTSPFTIKSLQTAKESGWALSFRSNLSALCADISTSVFSLGTLRLYQFAQLHQAEFL